MEKDKIEKQIEEAKKIPVELKERIMQNTYKNIMTANMIFIYVIFLNLGYKNINKNIFIKDLKVFSISLLIVSILLIEKAYKSKNKKTAVTAVEVLIIGIVTLFLQYAYFSSYKIYNYMATIMAVVFAVYYILKSVYNFLVTRRNFRNNISDIKEITKNNKGGNER